MSDTTFRFSVLDPSFTTQSEGDQKANEKMSADLKRQLEEDYGVKAQRSSVGFNAAAAAYLLEVDWKTIGVAVVGLITVFFQGKNVADNAKAWHDMFVGLKDRVLGRKPVLDRSAAAVVAVNAINEMSIEHLNSFQLVGYARSGFEEQVYGREDNEGVLLIEDGPDDERLLDWVHVFRISSNGAIYRILVHRGQVTKYVEERPLP